MSENLVMYGGQAVLEGVMMRGSKAMAVAVRDPSGGIRLLTKPLGRLYRGRMAKIPFARGLLGLWDALGLGMQGLTFSANVLTGLEQKIEGPAIWGAAALSLAFAIALFFLAPAAAGAGVESIYHRLFGAAAPNSLGWVGNLAEGLIRLALMVGYLWGIGWLPEIKRVYAYHGAEHKTINAFEAGAPLTPESVARFPLEHPRCGTAFLLVVVISSILLFSLLGPLPLPQRLLSRVLLVPALAAVAFEYLRFTARHVSHPLVRLLVAPNLALQRLTTREPDHKMLEVAIRAFEEMRRLEGAQAA